MKAAETEPFQFITVLSVVLRQKWHVAKIRARVDLVFVNAHSLRPPPAEPFSRQAFGKQIERAALKETGSKK